MKPRRNWQQRVYGFALGVAVTLVTVLSYAAGWLRPLENWHHDLSFRHFNRVPADPRIVLVDINDYALEQIGHWPWSRTQQADLVSLLAECGAQQILLDLVYTELTQPEVPSPRFEPDFRFFEPPEILGESDLTDMVYGDLELARAIEQAGNVYVAMLFRMEPPQRQPHRLRAAVRATLDEDPAISLEDFRKVVASFDPPDPDLLYLLARVDHALRQQFDLDLDALAERVGLPPEQIEEHFADRKARAARYLVDRYLDDHPAVAFGAVLAAILPDHPPQLDSRDREDLEDAWLDALAWQTLPGSVVPGAGFEGVIPKGTNPQMPITDIAQAAYGIGFVTFEKDDGVVRRVPLLAEVDSVVVPQLAFALALDALGRTYADLAVEGRSLSLLSAKGERRLHLPLNENGGFALNWHVDRREPTWLNSFTHIPVAHVMEVADSRKAIAVNESQLPLLLDEAAELMFGGAPAAYEQYRLLVRQRNELRRARRHWRQPDGGEPEAPDFAKLTREIDVVNERALANLAWLKRQIEGETPQDEEEAALFARVQRLCGLLLDDAYAIQIKQHNDRLQLRIDARLAELKKVLGGKICLVGHTAAAQADMVNTPVFDSMPGVMAHANLINTLLTERIPTEAPRLLNVGLVLLCGLLITYVAMTRGPRVSFLTELMVVLFSLSLSACLMWAYGHYLAAVIPAAGSFVTWAFVTLYRQATEEALKRNVAKALSRNTSPAIAAKILDQLEDIELSPQPANVTCYFSDLQGFTALSERLGAEATKTVLNTYLGLMGEVLVSRRAFNKFMGDGIFAFFNAPIWPVANHVEVACEAALETLERLDSLRRSHDADERSAYRDLRMRVGLHTGHVFVGYFGSRNQTDYTCIGDTVNLAARLESANKYFGTRILVSAAIRDAMVDQYAYRALGGLQVLGKVQSVAVYELLGRRGEIDDAARRYADLFATAVEAFQQRDWDSAAEQFIRCTELHPDDEAARSYLQQIDQYRIAPPPADWNQAIELRSK